MGRRQFAEFGFLSGWRGAPGCWSTLLSLSPDSLHCANLLQLPLLDLDSNLDQGDTGPVNTPLYPSWKLYSLLLSEGDRNWGRHTDFCDPCMSPYLIFVTIPDICHHTQYLSRSPQIPTYFNHCPAKLIQTTLKYFSFDWLLVSSCFWSPGCLIVIKRVGGWRIPFRESPLLATQARATLSCNKSWDISILEEEEKGLASISCFATTWSYLNSVWKPGILWHCLLIGSSCYGNPVLCNFLFLLGSFLRIWNLLRQKNSKKSFFYDGITSVATFCKLLVEYLAWVNAGLVGDGGMDGWSWLGSWQGCQPLRGRDTSTFFATHWSCSIAGESHHNTYHSPPPLPC